MKRKNLFNWFIVLVVLFSCQKVNAAEGVGVPGTLTISPALYNQLTTEGWCATNQTGPTDFVAIAGGGEPGHWYPPIPTCVDGLTPELIAEAEAAANSLCIPVFVCVQRGNCEFEAIIFYPTNPRCIWSVPPYASEIAISVVATGPIGGREMSPTSTQQVVNNTTAWSLYPNPTSGTLNLSSNVKVAGDHYKITNMLGQVLLTNTIQQQATSIDVSNLASGMYIFNVFSDNDKVQTLKFFKQ